MLFGIMSDSHDNLTALEEAVSIMKDREIDVLFHCGDFIAPFSIPPLKKTGAAAIYAVFGNNDGEKKGLRTRFSEIGGMVEKAPFLYRAGGRGIFMMHENYFLPDAYENDEADIILYGHNHRLSIEEKRGKIIINPGEICGYLTGKRSFVLLDSESMKAEVIEF